jgi:hypothetical protein
MGTIGVVDSLREGLGFLMMSLGVPPPRPGPGETWGKPEDGKWRYPTRLI